MNEEDLVVFENEDNELQEEENILQNTETSAEMVILSPETIDINESFFMGAKVSVVMCCLSLGIGAILTIFRRVI